MCGWLTVYTGVKYWCTVVGTVEVHADVELGCVCRCKSNVIRKDWCSSDMCRYGVYHVSPKNKSTCVPIYIRRYGGDVKHGKYIVHLLWHVQVWR